MIDEYGDEIEFEDDSDDVEENRDAQYMDEQEVVQEDSDDWVDEDGDGEVIGESAPEEKDPAQDEAMEGDQQTKKKKKKSKKKAHADDYGDEAMDQVGELPAKQEAKPQIWNDLAEPLKDGEELEFDSAAYEMLHRSNVEWPCLSLDVLVRDRIGGPTGILSQPSWFPSQVGGALDPSQAVFDQRLNLNKHKDDNYPMSLYFCAGS